MTFSGDPNEWGHPVVNSPPKRRRSTDSDTIAGIPPAQESRPVQTIKVGIRPLSPGLNRGPEKIIAIRDEWREISFPKSRPSSSKCAMRQRDRKLDPREKYDCKKIPTCADLPAEDTTKQ